MDGGNSKKSSHILISFSSGQYQSKSKSKSRKYVETTKKRRNNLQFCSFLVLYHANEGLEPEEENFNEADKGEAHAESKRPPNVSNESCGRHHLKAV